MSDQEINPVLSAGITHTLAGASDATILETATNMIPATLISGFTQLANAAESVADVVGLGWGQLDTATAVHAADDLLNTNMSEYYKQHQEGADLIGFLGSSLVPGTIGVKALRAAQAGIAVGRTTGIATGLLTNTAEVQLLNRAKTVIESGASIGQINKARVAAALARGGQLALEGIAFDMAVFSAMNENPILAEYSTKDYVTQSLTFGALFGGLGAGWNYFSQFGKPFTVNSGSLFGKQTTLRDIEYEVGQVTTAAASIKLSAAGPKTSALAPEIQVFDPMDPTKPLRMYHGSATKLTIEDINSYQSRYPELHAGAMFLSADPGIATSYATGKSQSAGTLNTATVTPRSPMVMSFESSAAITEANFAAAKQAGNDSVIRVDSSGVVREIAVLDKSIIHDLNVTLLTHGDDAVDIAAALDNSFAPAVRQELDALVSATRTRREEVLKTKAAEVAAALASDAHTAQRVHQSILDLSVDKVAAIYSGAVRVSKVVLDDPTLVAGVKGGWRLSSTGLGARAMVVDLTTGAATTSPVLGAADLGKIVVSKNSAAAGDFVISPATHVITEKSAEFEGELLHAWGAHNASAATFDLRTPSGIVSAYGAITKNVELRIINSMGVPSTISAKDAAAAVDSAYNSAVIEALFGQDLPTWFVNTSWANYAAPTAKWVKVEYGTWMVPSAWNTRGTAEWTARVTAAQEHNRLAVRAIFPDMDLPTLNIQSVGSYDIRQATSVFKGFNAAYESAMEAAGYVGAWVQTKTAALRETRAVELLSAEQTLRGAGVTSEQAVLFNAVVSRIRGTQEWTRIDPAAKELFTEHVSQYSSTTREVILAASESAEAAAVYDYFAALHAVDSKYLKQNRQLDALAGRGVSGIPDDGIYIPPYALAKTPYMVIVADPTGAKAVLRAASAVELQDKVKYIRSAFPEYSVYDKEATDAFFKLKGEWEFESAFTRTATDSALRNDGVLRDLDVKSGWQELDEINEWLTRKEFSLIRRAVSANYAQEFAEATALSKTVNPYNAKLQTFSAKLGNDAYSTVINTALNVRAPSAHPYWEYFNNGLNKLFEGTASTLWDLGAKLRTSQINVTEANKILRQRGVNDAAFTEELWKFAAKPDFSNAALDTMARVRHLLNTTVLRLDFFNPVVQVLGMPIMLMPAIREATASVRSMGDEVPMFKMLNTAVKNLFDKNMISHYADKGIISKGVVAHANMIDAAGLVFRADSSARVLEQAGIVQSKFDKFVNFFAKPTDWAEHAQRFIAADVGRQVAEMRGLISGTPGYWAFINNFAAKINGTYVAAQRPTLFTGIAGQAISVFQTYQFNLMQQFAKHIENGDKKTLALMLGLQGTIYGAGSLPGFKLLNQELLGEWTRDNTDAYSLSEKYLPDQLGKAVMYGLASNVLQASLWSRGDVTPRTPTLVPVTPQDTVAVSMAIKAGNAFMDLMGTTMGQFKEANPNFAVGVAEAIAHAGINRPLAGLAEVALGARTSRDGKLDVDLRQHDVLSWATAVRLLGAKPIDEAIAMDAYQRQLQYRTAMRERTAAISEALRTHAIGTGEIPPDLIESFAQSYTRAGGSIENFRSAYLRALRDATTPRAVILAQQMRESPSAKNYQWAMGADGELPSADNFLVGDNPTK